MKKAIKKTGMVERKECIMASSELKRLIEKIKWPKKEVATKIKKTKKVGQNLAKKAQIAKQILAQKAG